MLCFLHIKYILFVVYNITTLFPSTSCHWRVLDVSGNLLSGFGLVMSLCITLHSTSIISKNWWVGSSFFLFSSYCVSFLWIIFGVDSHCRPYFQINGFLLYVHKMTPFFLSFTMSFLCLLFIIDFLKEDTSLSSLYLSDRPATSDRLSFSRQM